MSVMSEVALEQWERNTDVSQEPDTEEEPGDDMSDILSSIRAMGSSDPSPETPEPVGEILEAGAQPAGENKETDPPAGDAAAKAEADAAEDQRRKEHEEAEAKRKAQWEADQAAKKRKEQEALAKINAMSDEDLMAAAAEQAGLQAEKLTRRNMKILVTAVVQEECRKDPAFARLVMNPKKDMAKCFQYINRHARKFIEDEMKANGEKQTGGMFGGDVPDDICYQWALDYFRDLKAEEDKEPEEKFVPKPYVGSGKTSGKAPKKAEKKKPEPKPAAPKKQAPEGQIGFGEMLGAA